MAIRMYLGRTLKSELHREGATVEPLDANATNALLWEQHELFQDAVNYYSLCLAAMLRADPNTFDLGERSGSANALAEWRNRVIESWTTVERRGRKYPGPQGRIAPLLGLAPNASFDDAAARALHTSKASSEQLFRAALYLVEKCEGSALNEIVGSKLPVLAAPAGQNDSTPDNLVAAQNAKAGRCLIELRDDPGAFLKIPFEPGFFITKYPDEFIVGKAARDELERKLVKLERAGGTIGRCICSISSEIRRALDKALNADTLRIPVAGRKPKGIYPIALLYSLIPSPLLRDLLLQLGKPLMRAAEVAGSSGTAQMEDDLAKARVDDAPTFSFFSTLISSAPSRHRAVWFEYDKAAFIEAINYPHRYLQDTLERNKIVKMLSEDISAFEGAGRVSQNHSDEESDDGLPGFDGDSRIALLRQALDELTSELTGIEDEAANRGQFELHRRTIKGWSTIKQKWGQKAKDNQPVKTDDLQRIIAQYQQENPTQIGSISLYRKLAEPRFHAIWISGPSAPHHADDVLQAWVAYTDLKDQLKDASRPIRFTPADATESPRFFDIPKSGPGGAEHLGVGSLRIGVFTTAAVGKFSLSHLSICYASPRLRRDLPDTAGIAAANWVQPLIEPFQATGKFSATHKFSSSAPTLYAKGRRNIQLGFPVDVTVTTNLELAELQLRGLKGKEQYGLRWPGFEQSQKSKLKGDDNPWYKKLDQFRLLSVDLGQRFAGASARLLIHRSAGERPGRSIGRVGDTRWYAKLERTSTLRLPGEDVRGVWRPPTKSEVAAGMTVPAWRGELYGDRGRSAAEWESQEAIDILTSLELGSGSAYPGDWQRKLSYPEQNDALLRAYRAKSSELYRLFRWAAMLSPEASLDKSNAGLEEISQDRVFSVAFGVTPETAALNSTRTAVQLEIIKRIPITIEKLKTQLERIAIRCFPIRSSAFRFYKAPGATSFILSVVPDPTARKRRAVGQRGLSMKRLEQLQNLRRCFMSLNRMLIRSAARAADNLKGKELPEPCDILLRKIDKLKEQRTFQTAHLILQEALGLEQVPLTPDTRTSPSSRITDRHGAYRIVRPSVDVIVIENLARYRFDQGRSKWENSRLMQWCHRQIAAKLKQMCEIVGMPVVEVHAGYSSQFCANTGVVGFRAEAVGPGFWDEPYWAQRISKDDEEAKYLRKIKEMLLSLNLGCTDRRKTRYLYIPRHGGEYFIPIVGTEVEGRRPGISQADINAAINLGLRAVAQPGQFDISQRLRTRSKGARREVFEPRVFRSPPSIELSASENSVEAALRNPNIFRDVAQVVPWGHAKLDGTHANERFVLAKALFATVKDQQWKRVIQIGESLCKRKDVATGESAKLESDRPAWL